MTDYYELLEVHPKASAEVIKKAYLVLAKKFHPDTCPLPKHVAEQKMKELNEAYNILSNPATREKFDREYAVYVANQRQKETYEAMKAANEAATKKKQEEAEKVYKQEIQKRTDNINEICLNYIDRIRKYIINDTTSTDQLQRAVTLLNIFYQETSADYKFLFDNDEVNSYTAETYGATLLWFGQAFIQYGDTKNAGGVITYAERFIPASSANYPSLISLKEQVNGTPNLTRVPPNNDKLKTVYNERKDNNTEESSENNMDKAVLKLILLLVAGMILVCVIGTFAFSGVNDKTLQNSTVKVEQQQVPKNRLDELAEYIKRNSSVDSFVEKKYRPSNLDTAKWIAIGAIDNKNKPEDSFVQYYNKDSIIKINDPRLPGKHQIAYDTLIVLPNDKNLYYYIQHQVFCYNDANKIGAVALKESHYEKDGKVIRTFDCNPDKVRMTEDECNNSILATLRNVAPNYIK